MALGKHSSKMLWILLAAGLLTGCDGREVTEDIDTETTSDEGIQFEVDMWQMMQSAPSRATLITSLSDLQTNGFKCYAYFDGTTDAFIGGSNVNYDNGTSAWSFHDGIVHYWPNTGALDFFAHSPQDLTNTCCTFDYTAYVAETNIDGYTEGTPRIVCTGLPTAITSGSDNTEELMLAYTANQSKGSVSSAVTLNFVHPFAAIAFTLDESCRSTVTVNSITIAGNIYNKGTCAYNGSTVSWTPSGTTSNFSVTGNPVLSSTSTSNGPYLVLPQTVGSAVTFTVNATWTEWGNPLTTDVSTTVDVGTWAAGTKYTYNLVISKYAITVETSKFTEQW